MTVIGKILPDIKGQRHEICTPCFSRPDSASLINMLKNVQICFLFCADIKYNTCFTNCINCLIFKVVTKFIATLTVC